MVYRSFAEATGLRPLWNAFAKNDFMLQWEWLSNAWEHYHAQGNGRQHQLLIVAFVAPDGEVVGIAPLYRRRGLAGRVLRFVGDGKLCSDYVRVLTQDDWTFAVYERLAEWVSSDEFQRMHGAIDWIEIEGHTNSNLGWVTFWNTLVRKRWSRQSRPIEGSWRTQFLSTRNFTPQNQSKAIAGVPFDDATYKAFYNELSKSRKRKVKKAIKLRNEGQVDFLVLSSKQSIEDEWSTFVGLHQRRRESLGQAGCFADKSFATFLRSASLDFAEKNQVTLAKLLHQNNAIGYLLMFSATDTLAMYQSGLDPDFENFEPGHLINSFALQFAMEQGYRFYDFLRGDEPYKSGWNAERIELQRTRCTSPRLSSQLINNLWNTGRSLRGWRSQPTTPNHNHTAD